LTNQHIVALAVNAASASQTLYAGSEDGTVFSSSDGQHWTKRERVAAVALTRLVVAPAGKTLYALTSRGLFASTDNAQTWQSVSTVTSGLPDDGYTTLAFDGQKDMYVGTRHNGIFMSNGMSGTHWKAIGVALPRAINELVFDGTQHRIWAATAGGVYRSEDMGVSWDALNTGLSVVDGVTTVQLVSNAGGDPQTVYVGTQRGIFRSIDAGLHWAESGQLLHNIAIRCVLIDFRSTNGSTIYVGTPYGAFRSDDSGQNWHGVGGGLAANTPVAALAIGKDKASQLYAAANTVYLFPGVNTGINPSRVVTLLLLILLFVSLFFIAKRGTRRRKAFLKTQKNAENTSPTT